MSTIKHVRQTVFGMTQQAFASETGIPQSTLSRWESGGAPDLEGVKRMRSAAQRLSLDWDDLWFLGESPPHVLRPDIFPAPQTQEPSPANQGGA